ncbi:MAG TPA: phosphate ABC transporter substrate-binding protein [Clostridiales bacterium]|nr:phosphate ABC transporter substrate-binding protein [Clostridiales bacterium]
MKKLLALILALTALSAFALAEFDLSQTIAVVSREEGSGTRGAFIELTGVQKKNDEGKDQDYTYAEADFVNGTSLVITTVSTNPAAIGYASLSSVLLNDTVKSIRIDGVEPTTENILNKTYPIARPFNLVSKGELTNPLAVDFMNFVMSKQGQEVVAEDGLVPVNQEAAEYTAANLSGLLVVGGSTSVAPVMELLAEAYTELNPEVEVDVQSTGSSAGVTGALDETYMIGMASRELKDSEIENGALAVAIGIDGIAVINALDNPVSDLTLEQVRQIYTGEVTTWDAVAK